MSDVVFVQTLGMAISMGAIVVAGSAAGVLLWWLDGKADHGDAH